MTGTNATLNSLLFKNPRVDYNSTSLIWVHENASLNMKDVTITDLFLNAADRYGIRNEGTLEADNLQMIGSEGYLPNGSNHFKARVKFNFKKFIV